MAVWVKSSPRIIIKHMQGVVKANEGEGETGTVVLCGRQNTLCVALGESCAICVLGCLLCGLAFSLHHVRSIFLSKLCRLCSKQVKLFPSCCYLQV